jgi:small subunit ribosomal protein S17
MNTMEQPKQSRGQRRSAIGVVTRDKMNKTRRVEIARLVKHPRYGKYIRRRTVCYVHDEANDSRTGDTVEIMETRPLSKMKHWRLVKVVKRAPILPQPGKQAQAAAGEEAGGAEPVESGQKAEG